MTQQPGHITHPEISAQAAALQAAWEQLERQSDWVKQTIGNSKYDEVVFIGSGSSYYQALAMAATYRRWTGRSAAAHPSSDIFLFRAQTAPGATKQYLLVGVSRSGESTEVVLAIDSVKDLPNWDIAGITCYENSSLAQRASCLVSPLGKETSTVMTKSFSSMTFMMQAAIALAAGQPALTTEMAATLAADAAIVAQSDAFAKPIADRGFTNYIYLGMGAYYGLALEACLKIKEMSYVWTEAYGTLEFRHGPKSIIEPGSLVVLLLSEQARSYEIKVAQEMQAYGAFVVILTAKAGEDTAFADAVLELGGEDRCDEARAALYLPALQYLGFYTALQRGVDPDQPRNLTQVVKI